MGKPATGSGKGGDRADLPDVYEAHVTGTRDELQSLLGKFDLDVGCRHAHVTENEDRSLTLLVYASEERIAEISGTGYAVERGENVSALGRERQAEIGKGDRFDGGRSFPKGLGELTSRGQEGSAR